MEDVLLASELRVRFRAVTPSGKQKLAEGFARLSAESRYRRFFSAKSALTAAELQFFTRSVRIDPLFEAKDPARAVGASVTFERGARTAWHTHPLGQTPIVTAGCGWVQHEGGPVEEIQPNDMVWFPPGEMHWHGATATAAMTHIAIQEQLDGKVDDWMEKSATSNTASEQVPPWPLRKLEHPEGNRTPEVALTSINLREMNSAERSRT